MSKPEPDPSKRLANARKHYTDHEAQTAIATGSWEVANRKYVRMLAEFPKTTTERDLEAMRITCVSAYEAMLDAIKTEKDALFSLDVAVKVAAVHKRPKEK